MRHEIVWEVCWLMLLRKILNNVHFRDLTERNMTFRRIRIAGYGLGYLSCQTRDNVGQVVNIRSYCISRWLRIFLFREEVEYVCTVLFFYVMI